MSTISLLCEGVVLAKTIGYLLSIDFLIMLLRLGRILSQSFPEITIFELSFVFTF